MDSTRTCTYMHVHDAIHEGEDMHVHVHVHVQITFALADKTCTTTTWGNIAVT